jgi:membrane fusion protein (multidrug efflux system)
VIVKSGLNEGDRLVIDGVQLLHDGSRITTSNKPAQGANKNGATGSSRDNKKK